MCVLLNRLTLQSQLTLIRALSAQIKMLEKSILPQVEPDACFDWLKTAPGIGDILAETILLETGDITRLKAPGNFASYCRCVDSRRESNGKKKCENNRKNGRQPVPYPPMFRDSSDLTPNVSNVSNVSNVDDYIRVWEISHTRIKKNFMVLI